MIRCYYKQNNAFILIDYLIICNFIAGIFKVFKQALNWYVIFFCLY